jgi:hypothetical protein
MSGKKGDARLARLRTLIDRIEQACGGRVAAIRAAHGYLLRIAHLLDPDEQPASGAEVRECVEAVLEEISTAIEGGTLPLWLHGPMRQLVALLRRLGDYLYHCYDVPGLPRTNNDLEHFYRRLKCTERRITGHKRSDSFVVRAGGFAVYAVLAADIAEADLQNRLAGVAAEAWRQERATLHDIQERQIKMRRFHLRRAAYLADLEARWPHLPQPP